MTKTKNQAQGYEVVANPGSLMTEIEKTKLEEFQNKKLIKKFWIRLQKAEFACLIVSVVAIGLTIVAYPYIFADDHEAILQSLLYAAFLLSIIQVLLTIYRQWAELTYLKIKGFAPADNTLLNPTNLIPLVIECVIIMTIPYPWLQGITFTTTTLYGDSDIYYQVNEVLQLISTVRILVTLRALLVISYWNSDRAQRLTLLYGGKPGLWFVLRSIMKDTPGRIAFTAYFASIPFFAYLVMLAEGPTSRLDDSINYNYLNSLWNIIITTTTVGYGDYFPRTLLGRTVIFFVSIWGTIVISLLVVTLTALFAMNSAEERSYGMLRKLYFKDLMQRAATSAVLNLFRASILARKTGQSQKDKVENYQFHIKELKLNTQ